MLNKGLERGLLNQSWVMKTEVSVSVPSPSLAALTAYLMWPEGFVAIGVQGTDALVAAFV